MIFRNQFFIVVILLHSIQLKIDAQKGRDSSDLVTPYVYSSWNGGIAGFKDHNVHYQTINGACHTLLYQFKGMAEVGITHLLRSEVGLAMWAKYHLNLGQRLRISPTLMTLPIHRYFYNSGRITEKFLKVFPGIQTSVKMRHFLLSGSYYHIGGIASSEVDEHAFLFEESMLNRLYTVQGIVTYGRSTLNIEYFNFETENRMDRSQIVQQGNLNITFSFQISRQFSTEFGYWARLNNHNGYCDLACFEGFPRLGISFKF